ncbi:phosphotransferase [Streptomyces albipurpureus]|uniref:Aminoglycoside phosphotransferase family protein n=1 Tax=Streptomyces albipurpureus TaxID=2897419 RepID=A0ABT0UTV3_9ACTN|nr:phosphotransferase [Streptomyces sp. CWNU-1]MCM2392017.1 aminoglycoside phosphotransferase family protein [Streptomyces sp. CWNU-1]
MTEPHLPGGYTSDELTTLLAQACEELGLDGGRPRLLRGHTNAVVLLGAVVLKIARKGTTPQTLERTVALVRWLQDQGFPTVPFHPTARQPLHLADGALATVWTYLPQPANPITAADLAAPLAALHRLHTPPVPVRQLDNLTAIRRSLATTRTLDAEDWDFLSHRADQLEHALTQVEYVLAPSIVQGDPQHRNALHDTAGDLTVLCDWDTVALGQPEWDLVTVEIHCRRFGYGPRHWADFADGYGTDVTTWPGYRVLRDIRELRMITTNARKAAHTPGSLSEVQRRIKGLREEEDALLWSIL